MKNLRCQIKISEVNNANRYKDMEDEISGLADSGRKRYLSQRKCYIEKKSR